MSQDRPGRLRELFAAAIELDGDRRTAFLDAQCSGDEALRAEIDSLLAHHLPSSRFMETPAVYDASRTHAGDESHAVGTLPAGTVIAGYTIVRVIGAGGMGVVYAAEQAAPRRLVALKLMRSGLVSRSALRRFEHEGEALARLKHPGIAQVFQAGTESRSGVLTPFIAMELVEGEPLGAFAASAGPALDRRLDLFAHVCDAVAHAHQRGVLHRDLKPANILVVRDPAAGPRPKILDFGIARLTDDESAGAATLTQPGAAPGTLAYMAPEQLGFDPASIDLRCDVYSLGVLLYELLTGRLPIDPTRLTIAEAARRIRETEPPRPGAIDRRLRGDLETIIRKAMEKEPSRRYASAADLAQDIRRFLRHEPIAARPPTLGYVARRFVRRHRLVVGAAAAIFLALGAGLAAALHQAEQARRQLEVARQTSTLLEEIFSSVEPERALGREVTVREAIDAASAKLERSQIRSPEILASLHGAISRVYMSVGEPRTAIEHGRRAVDYSREAFGDDHAETLFRTASAAQMLYVLDRHAEAITLLEPAIERSMRVHGESALCTIRLLTSLGNAQGHTQQSVQTHRRVVGILEQSRGPECEELLHPLNNLAVGLVEVGEFAEAESVLNRCDRLRRVHLGPDHPDHLVTLQNFITLFDRSQRHAEAADVAEKLVSEGDRILGRRHPKQVFNRFNCVMAIAAAGRLARGVEILDINIPAAQTLDGNDTPMSVRCRGLRATLLIALKRFGEALPAAEQTLAAAARVHGDPSDQVAQSWTLFYDYYEATGEPDKQAVWREKIATTPAGKAALEAEAAQKAAAGQQPAPANPRPSPGP